MAENAVIMWANDETQETPEREEAVAAVNDILALFGIQVGGVLREQAIQRVLAATGVAERHQYDIGWKHCEDALRE